MNVAVCWCHQWLTTEHRLLQSSYNKRKARPLYLKVYFAPTQKNLGAKDFPVMTSVTVHLSKIVILQNIEREKENIIYYNEGISTPIKAQFLKYKCQCLNTNLLQKTQVKRTMAANTRKITLAMFHQVQNYQHNQSPSATHALTQTRTLIHKSQFNMCPITTALKSIT